VPLLTTILLPPKHYSLAMWPFSISLSAQKFILAFLQASATLFAVFLPATSAI